MKKVESDIIIAHPHKHHAFNLAAGCLQSGGSVFGAFPLYRKGVCKLVSLLPGPVGRKADGYKHEAFDGQMDIDAPLEWQLRKLWTFAKSEPEAIEPSYDHYVSKRISSREWNCKILITLQDHMPLTTLVASSLGIKLWSDQIINYSDDALNRMSRHSREFNLLPPVHNEKNNNRILAHANWVTVPSTYTLDGIRARTPEECRTTIIPYGVHPSFDVRNRENASSKIRILARANSVRKGGHLLLGALLDLPKSIIQLLEVRILGRLDPSLRPLAASVRKQTDLQLIDGNVPNADVPRLMQASDIFLLPTLSESMSLACAEAMQSGLPIVTTEYAGMDYFVPGEMGLIIDDSVQSVKHAIEQCIVNRDKLRQWGAAARKVAMENDWDNYERKVGQFARIALDSL